MHRHKSSIAFILALFLLLFTLTPVFAQSKETSSVGGFFANVANAIRTFMQKVLGIPVSEGSNNLSVQKQATSTSPPPLIVAARESPAVVWQINPIRPQDVRGDVWDVERISNILQRAGASLPPSRLEEAIRRARQEGLVVSSEAIPELVYTSTTPSGANFGTHDTVRTTGSDGHRYIIRTWTKGPLSTPVSQDLHVTVWWQAILVDRNGTPLLVDQEHSVETIIPKSNHAVSRCLNYYYGMIPIPSHYGVTEARFEHVYESFSMLQQLASERRGEDVSNCFVQPPNGQEFVTDVTAAEFELFVRMILGEAANYDYQAKLDVAAIAVSILQDTQQPDFRRLNSLGEVLMHGNLFTSVKVDKRAFDDDRDPYSVRYDYAEEGRRAAIDALLGNPGSIPKSPDGRIATQYYSPASVANEMDKCYHRHLDFAGFSGPHAFFYIPDHVPRPAERAEQCRRWMVTTPDNRIIPDAMERGCPVAARRAAGEKDPLKNTNYTIWCNMDTAGL